MMKTALVGALLAIGASSQALTLDFEDLYGGGATTSGSIAPTFYKADGVTFNNWGWAHLDASSPSFYLNGTTCAYSKSVSSIVFANPVDLQSATFRIGNGSPVATVTPSPKADAITITGISGTAATLNLSSYGPISEIDVSSSVLLLDSLTFTPVPEPMTLLALAGGIVALARRKKA